MKEPSSIKSIFIFAILIIVNIFSLTGQTQAPEVLQEGTLEQQLDYVQERTRIYENFRAIREDMFQLVKNNSLDSLNEAKARIREYTAKLEEKDVYADSLNMQLEDVREELKMAVENRDRLFFLGIPMHKTGYNILMWLIIAGLSVLLIFGFLLYIRNRSLTVGTLKDLEELKEDFEAFRKRSRETKEKLVMDHFNELKKYKNTD